MGTLISKHTLDPPCAILGLSKSRLDNGKYIAAVGSNTDKVYIFDSETLELSSTVLSHDFPMYGADFANKSPYFVTCGQDGSIQLFHIK